MDQDVELKDRLCDRNTHRTINCWGSKKIQKSFDPSILTHYSSNAILIQILKISNGWTPNFKYSDYRSRYLQN